MTSARTLARALADALASRVDPAVLSARIAARNAAKTTIYRVLRGDGAPSLATVAEVARVLDVYVVVTPDGRVMALDGTKIVTTDGAMAVNERGEVDAKPLES